jgi:DnaJ domain
MVVKDYYAILNIESSATVTEIKAAYRNLAKRYHPDIVGDDLEKKLLFDEIKEAYENLITPSLRYLYHEKRWLLKSEGKSMAALKIWSPAQILKDCIALDKSIYTMDRKRNHAEYIALQIGELLTDDHVAMLNQHQDETINYGIVNLIIKMIPEIPYSYCSIIKKRIIQIKVHHNEGTAIALDKAIHKNKTNHLVEKYKWLVVLSITILLLLLIANIKG